MELQLIKAAKYGNSAVELMEGGGGGGHYRRCHLAPGAPLVVKALECQLLRVSLPFCLKKDSQCSRFVKKVKAQRLRLNLLRIPALTPCEREMTECGTWDGGGRDNTR
jgi:hypothetical protein